MKLPALNPQAFSQLLGVASDVALVLDLQGTIEDVSVARDSLGALGCQAWVGRRWLDTVTSESRAKIQDMLISQGASESMRWRHVNHPTPMGNDVAVQYVLLPLGEGKLLAVGRDLESLAELQRRLVETQQSMERDYLRLRHIEARYRVLFDTSSEAVLVVDANNQRVLRPMWVRSPCSRTPASACWAATCASVLNPAAKVRCKRSCAQPWPRAALKCVRRT